MRTITALVVLLLGTAAAAPVTKFTHMPWAFPWDSNEPAPGPYKDLIDSADPKKVLGRPAMDPERRERSLA